MPAKKNPLGLNPLQLKTLTLMQELARSPNHGSPRDGGAVEIGNLPHPHGNHFHVGDAVVMTADASGLANEGAWKALERKGLIRSDFPYGATVTAEGLAYETGLADKILHRADH
jgi:hypothetical protein